MGKVAREAPLAPVAPEERVALLDTHDAADARLLGRRIAVLEAGRVTQAGRWEKLVARPASRFVEELVASARGGGE